MYDEIRGLEVEYGKMKSSVDNSLRKETQFQQELRDADKNADKMASKESIYLEKQVWRFGCILPISHIGDFQGKKEIFKKKNLKNSKSTHYLHHNSWIILDNNFVTFWG